MVPGSGTGGVGEVISVRSNSYVVLGVKRLKVNPYTNPGEIKPPVKTHEVPAGVPLQLGAVSGLAGQESGPLNAVRRVTVSWIMKASESFVISIVVIPFASVVKEQPEGPSKGKQFDWLKLPLLPVGPSAILGSTASAFAAPPESTSSAPKTKTQLNFLMAIPRRQNSIWKHGASQAPNRLGSTRSERHEMIELIGDHPFRRIIYLLAICTLSPVVYPNCAESATAQLKQFNPAHVHS
jgi:hypothetical protein